MAFTPALKLPFGSGSLTLNQITHSDAQVMLPYFSSDEVCRFIPWIPRDLDGVADFIETRCGIGRFQADGDQLVLGAVDSKLGMVGQVNLFLKSSVHASAEIGYVTNPNLQGKGFATAAAALLLELAFGHLGVRRVTARIDERNLASVRVAERLGMRLEARELESELFKGEYVTMLSYAVLAKDWAKN